VIKLTPGTRVRFTGRYLKSTGQTTGPEGREIFTVISCPCARCADPTMGGWVAVDRKVAASYWTPEEIAAAPYLLHRHIAAANLQPVGKVAP
jgi:hypothetical protein